MAPQYVGDSMSSGCPGPTTARKIDDRPLWLPEMMSTSRAAGGVTPAGALAASSRANHSCSSGMPVTGERVIAALERAARAIAARTARSGSRSDAGYPECRPMASGATDRCVDESVDSRAGGAPSAPVCQP